MIRSILLLTAALLGCSSSPTLGGCVSCGGEPDPVIVVQPGSDRCEPACAHMETLNCEEATPVDLPDGGVMTCAQFCIYQHNNGIYWNTGCIEGITACEQIETVCNVPPP